MRVRTLGIVQHAGRIVGSGHVIDVDEESAQRLADRGLVAVVERHELDPEPEPEPPQEPTPPKPQRKPRARKQKEQA